MSSGRGTGSCSHSRRKSASSWSPLSTAYRSATTPDERRGLASAADAIIATTNTMPWAGVLTAAGILVLSLVAWRGPVPAGVAAFGIVTGAVGIVAELLRPLIDYGYLIYGPLLPTWFILTGWTLHTLGRDPTIHAAANKSRPNRGPRPPRTNRGLSCPKSAHLTVLHQSQIERTHRRRSARRIRLERGRSFTRLNSSSVTDAGLARVCPMNGVSGVHLLVGLRRRHAVGEGDGEGVQGWLPPHGPSCLTGALGVQGCG